jgi:LPXTG-site transpeptidase (sortase) family protein
MKASASIIGAVLVGALAFGLALTRSSSGEAARATVAQAPAALVRSPEGRIRPIGTAGAVSPQLPHAVGPPQIMIPRLGLQAGIGSDLNQGPIWWPVTGRPGGGDTIAIAGHRTTYSRPFNELDRLRPGDSIQVRWNGRMHTYRVSGTRILSARQLHIADARGHEVLLLSACHPKGSARQRIVVYAWPQA